MTPPFRNLLLWLRRIRRRCGYGVHSPFAFQLLEGVVYERLPYYAFPLLDRDLTWAQRFRVRRYLHLLFRLANYHHPDRILLSAPHPLEERYLLSACPCAEVLHDVAAVASASGLATANDAAAALATADNLIISSVAVDGTGSAAVPSSRLLLFLSQPDDRVLPLLRPGTMLLLANVHRWPTWWNALPAVLRFDLYDLGIAFFDPKYTPQDYIVNF